MVAGVVLVAMVLAALTGASIEASHAQAPAAAPMPTPSATPSRFTGDPLVRIDTIYHCAKPLLELRQTSRSYVEQDGYRFATYFLPNSSTMHVEYINEGRPVYAFFTVSDGKTLPASYRVPDPYQSVIDVNIEAPYDWMFACVGPRRAG